MAKNENKPAQTNFDFSAFLPEGYDASELKKTGGLTPIFSPKECEGLVVGGYLIGIEILPEIEMGKETYQPKMLRVLATAPTKGVLGSKGNRKVVDVAAGEYILIPITGNLGNNKEILSAALNREEVSVAVFRVEGKMDIGQPSEMLVWDAQLHPKRIARTSRYQMPNVEAAPQLTAGSNGAALHA